MIEEDAERLRERLRLSNDEDNAALARLCDGSRPCQAWACRSMRLPCAGWRRTTISKSLRQSFWLRISDEPHPVAKPMPARFSPAFRNGAEPDRSFPCAGPISSQGGIPTGPRSATCSNRARQAWLDGSGCSPDATMLTRRTRAQAAEPRTCLAICIDRPLAEGSRDGAFMRHLPSRAPRRGPRSGGPGCVRLSAASALDRRPSPGERGRRSVCVSCSSRHAALDRKRGRACSRAACDLSARDVPGQ